MNGVIVGGLAADLLFAIVVRGEFPSAVPFVPLGLIAIWGAVKAIDAKTTAEFEARRSNR